MTSQGQTIVDMIQDKILDDHPLFALLTSEQKNKLEDHVRERITILLDESFKKEKSIKIPFGKYKGRTVKEILISDRDYLNWLKTKCSFISHFKDLNDALQSLSFP